MTISPDILREIFQRRYDLVAWQSIMRDVFGAQTIATRPNPIAVPASEKGTKGFALGEADAADEAGHSAKIGFFLYETTRVKTRRAGLRALVKSWTGGAFPAYDAAIVVFADTQASAWRVSYVCDIKGEASSPKRFTYLFGEREGQYRTAASRLSALAKSRVPGSAARMDAIRDAFSVEALCREFYDELFAWYQWALSPEAGVRFPNDTSTDSDDRDRLEEHLIRLVTRLMFVWFILQKKLVPDDMLDPRRLSSRLDAFDPESATEGNFYCGILQNLFFATLDNPIPERAFASPGGGKNNEHFGVKTLYRNPQGGSWFKEPDDRILAWFRQVPFLNGGLFECLDKTKGDIGNDTGRHLWVDGFSRNSARTQSGHWKYRAFVPNAVFFAAEVDRAFTAGTERIEKKVSGLVTIFSRYNFTIEENSPSDADIALDPELLGKVFENLLGTYNPETRETARKSSGSFYTPREIVAYMVDESLRAALLRRGFDSETVAAFLSEDDLPTAVTSDAALRGRLREALLSIRALDPACGSGAFPMGLLARMVALLRRLEPAMSREDVYRAKLDIIRNCLYGVDIQTIAVQICKLRFFISLVCDQEPDLTDPDANYGIDPLPNLETKFVAANTLLGRREADRDGQQSFVDPRIAKARNQLQDVRIRHLSAHTYADKIKLRGEDRRLRAILADLLAENSFSTEDAAQLASYDPYDQNASADFFDPQWMFGLAEGFDIVIGNPPYFSLSTDSQVKDSHGRAIKHNAIYAPCRYETFKNTGDIYCLFYERGWQLLKDGGHLCYITSNKWMRAGYGEALRRFLAEKTNPEILIDFAGEKIFESATVDTNILLFQKRAKNAGKTIAAIGAPECRNDLSGFVRRSGFECKFAGSESWVILSPIEQSIKRKIEAVGTPLKDWDVSINYGIKTGCNEAFIVDEERRSEILSWCKSPAERKRTDELIRPILRGRDIKRYGYDWAELYILALFPARSYDIDNFPAIKRHLLSFAAEALVDGGRPDLAAEPYLSQFCRAKLEQSGKVIRIDGKPVVLRKRDGKAEEQKARKRTANKWFETQDTIAYWDDFSQPKIAYREISDAMDAVLLSGTWITNNKCYILTGRHLEFLLCFLNSHLFTRLILSGANLTGGKGFDFLGLVKLPLPTSAQEATAKELLRSSPIDDDRIEQFVEDVLSLSRDQRERTNRLSSFERP